MSDRVLSEEEVLARLPPDVDAAGRQLIARAYRVAAECHRGQTRKHGTPYLEHPLGVCLILLEEKGVTDPEVLAAALLHDVVEDSPTTPEMVRAAFGERVARMVAALTKDRREGPGKAERDRAYLQTLHQADAVTRLVKLADRLDNARVLHRAPDGEHRRRWWQETRDHYLPLARATDADLCHQLEEWVENFQP
ncbi:MAG: HD domain-containing protein [Armatimonadota bacterium]|nr:HD domain-containing protein [Armatimonadota bacterium]